MGEAPTAAAWAVDGVDGLRSALPSTQSSIVGVVGPHGRGDDARRPARTPSFATAGQFSYQPHMSAVFTDAMIKLQGLTKRYGDTLAVDDLTFEITPGCVTGFLGPNGAGKTTTMRMILGLDAPTKGTALVNGKPYGEHKFPLHEVGALLDAKALHGGRRAFDHLLCLAQSNGIGRKRVTTVLEQVGLADVAKKRAGTFSLGMGQRLGIAGALLGDPAVLMFDEPVNGLDPEGIVWIRTLLR